MKRLLLPLLAAFALPTAVNANDLLDQYNQQKAEQKKCLYYSKNVNWARKGNWGSEKYYSLDNNQIISVPYIPTHNSGCKQIGILNQNYSRKEWGFSEPYYITTFSRFENGNLVIYEKGKYNTSVVKKIILFPYRYEEVKPTETKDYSKLHERYKTYDDDKRYSIPNSMPKSVEGWLDWLNE
tara:strand:+ start:32 stop:577 length:546 start_codon:yes stop_codon:yes gene_type:complete